ncbi:MAG TPA: DUF6516 family protein [Candidatus Obscuribacterales bacterium]
MKATLLRQKKVVYPDESIAEIVVWQLPQPSPDRPHGYKYRLNYCTADGTTHVKYDNETSKGDHKHIDNAELPYEFESLEKLVPWDDITIELALAA